MKKLLLLLVFLPLTVFGQDKWSDVKYLEGAVPVVDGVVTFKRMVEAPGLTRDQIFVMLHKWAETRFQGTDDMQARLLYTDPTTGQIVCQGQEYMVFADKLLALDRAVVSYQLTLDCSAGKCNMTVTTILYSYNTGGANGKELLRAENMITDEHTLTRKKDKLIKATGKFRIGTIDLVNQLAQDVSAALDVKIKNQRTGDRELNGTTIEESLMPTEKKVPLTEVFDTENIPAVPIVATGTLPGFRQIMPDRIPGNIIKMLSEDWSLITAGKGDVFNMMTASWGGLGYLYNRPVAFCFIYPTRYTYQLMEKDSVYTISFYTKAYQDKLEYCGKNSGKNTDKIANAGLTPIVTPSGARAFAEAWMIIECRKMVAQSITPEAIFNNELKEEWAGKQLHKFYIGEILRVWVK